MAEALKEAEKAKEKGEVPIGAVVVLKDRIVGRGHNLKESKSDPTAHAEIEALRDAGKNLGRWRLTDCKIYVTLEPCPMCAGALLNARIGEVIFACRDPKAGCCGTLYQLNSDSRFNHRFPCRQGLMEREAQTLLKQFFQNLRDLRRRDGRVVEGA